MNTLSDTEIKQLICIFSKEYREPLIYANMDERDMPIYDEYSYADCYSLYEQQKRQAQDFLADDPFPDLYLLGVTPEYEAQFSTLETDDKNYIETLMEVYSLWLQGEFGIVPEDDEELDEDDIVRLRNIINAAH